MLKTIRVGKIEDQDQWRRDDTRKMTGNERVDSVLELQSRYLRWDLNPRIERVGKFTQLKFQDVS